MAIIRSVIPAVLIFTVVPVGGIITIGSHTFELQVADPPIGILLVLAMSGIAVYGVMLAGWSSGSPICIRLITPPATRFQPWPTLEAMSLTFSPLPEL